MQEILIDYGAKALYAVLVFVVAALYHKITKLQKDNVTRNKALEQGVQSLLRDRIIQSANYYTEKGYAPIYAKENITGMYNAYHELGANGTITNLYNDFMDLPTQEKR